MITIIPLPLPLIPTSQLGARFTYPGGPPWKAELTLVLIIYGDGLPVRRQSLIQVITTW